MFQISKAKWVGIGIGVLVCIISLLVWLQRGGMLLGDKGIVEMKITTKDLIIEVVYKNDKTYLYQNGEEVDILNALKRKPNTHLITPIIDKKLNLVEEKEPMSDMTWNATIEEGVMFINYLKDKGYIEVMKVESPYYIDVFLQKENKKVRVLLLNGKIMYGEVKKFPTFGSYIKDYIGGL